MAEAGFRPGSHLLCCFSCKLCILSSSGLAQCHVHRTYSVYVLTITVEPGRGEI